VKWRPARSARTRSSSASCLQSSRTTASPVNAPFDEVIMSWSTLHEEQVGLGAFTIKQTGTRLAFSSAFLYAHRCGNSLRSIRDFETSAIEIPNVELRSDLGSQSSRVIVALKASTEGKIGAKGQQSLETEPLSPSRRKRSVRSGATSKAEYR
jgi:hypothetical protein